MNVPKRIYHYTTKAIALEHILPTKKIRIGSLGSTNDPRETKDWGFPVHFRGDSSFEVVHKVQITANRIRRNEWWGLCTCQDDPDLVEPGPDHFDTTHFKYGYARARMWAQYAENHRGVCLELDGTALHEAIVRAVGEKPLFYGAINYVDEWDFSNLRERGDAFQFLYEPLSAMGLEDGVRDHIRRHYRHFMLEKSLDWKTETEFRWLVNSDSGPFLVDISDALRSVIVGVDFPSVYGPSLWHLCEGTGTRVERMYWQNRTPGKSAWDKSSNS